MSHENGGWMNRDQREAVEDEANAVRRDAERYRIIREGVVEAPFVVCTSYGLPIEEGQLDAAVDEIRNGRLKTSEG
jgi:hypothetical protein